MPEDDGDGLSLAAARKRAAERRELESASSSPTTPELSLPSTLRTMVTQAASRARERVGSNRVGDSQRSQEIEDSANALLPRESDGDGAEAADRTTPRQLEIPSPVGDFPQPPRPGLLPPLSSPGTLDGDDTGSDHVEVQANRGQAKRSEQRPSKRDSDDGEERLTLSVRLLKVCAIGLSMFHASYCTQPCCRKRARSIRASQHWQRKQNPSDDELDVSTNYASCVRLLTLGIPP